MIEALFVNTMNISLIKLGDRAINSRNTRCSPTPSPSVVESDLKRLGWIKVGGKAMVVWEDD